MQKKPLVYESVCIFSIVGSSIGFVAMFISCFFFSLISEKIQDFTNITATEKLSPFYFAILMAVYSVSLAGAIQLYRLQRIGLYFYLAAQAIILFLPVFWIGSNGLSVTNVIFTMLFSGTYLYYYRILRN